MNEAADGKELFGNCFSLTPHSHMFTIGT